MSSIYDEASLIIGPLARKSGKILCVKPEGLAVDFARAVEATEVDKDGNIVTVPANMPRFDHFDGGCPVILLEQQKTNFLRRSNEFDNVVYSTSNVTVTAGAVDPIGGTNAYTVETAGTSGYIQDFDTGTSGVDYTSSVWIKRNAGSGTVQMRCGGLPLLNISVSNEWQRVSVSAVSDSTTIRWAVYLPAGNSVDIFCGQLEEGSYPTSYIPTAGSAVTRVKDDAGTFDVFSTNTFTILVDVSKMLSPSTNSLMFYLMNGGSSGAIVYSFRQWQGTGPTPGMRLYDHVNSTYPLGADFAANGKFAFRINAGELDVFAGGVSGGSATGIATNTIDNIRFEDGLTTLLAYNGIYIFSKALSDAKCIALTT